MLEFDILTKIIQETIGVESYRVKSKIRTRQLVDIRIICANVLKENNKIGVEAIGELLCVNHSTVSYYLKTHKNIFKTEEKYRALYSEINEKYKHKLFVLNANRIRKELSGKKDKLLSMISGIDNMLNVLEE